MVGWVASNGGMGSEIPFHLGKGKGKAVHGTPSHSYGVSLAIWDHTSEHTLRLWTALQRA